jgi:hypothetical protein
MAPAQADGCTTSRSGSDDDAAAIRRRSPVVETDVEFAQHEPGGLPATRLT